MDVDENYFVYLYINFVLLFYFQTTTNASQTFFNHLTGT